MAHSCHRLYPETLIRDAVLELFTCDFVARKENVVLIGGVGTGKTHLSIALVVACCQKDLPARFTTATQLVNTLAEAKSL